MKPSARRVARSVAVAGVPALVLALAVTGVSRADAGCVSFGTVAAADGARVEANHTGYVVDQADAEGPAAQAVANSRGQSAGYAGAPYPGDAALSGIALAGQDPSALPVYVSSQYPTDPSNSRSTGSFELRSSSQPSSSHASAVGGSSVGAGTMSSTAQAGCDAGGAIASTAVTDAEAVSLAGGVLRLGRIHAEAHAAVGADGKTVLSSSLVVGNATVSGQAVQVTDKGLQYPGGEQALPGNPLAEALAAANITVTWVAAQKDPDGGGITAPGLRISVARTVSAAQPTVVTYTFGRGYARATTTPGEQPSTGPGGSGGQTGSGTGTTPQAGTGTSGGLAPGTGSSTGSSAPDTSGPAPEVSDPGSTGGAPRAGAVPAGHIGPLELPMSGLYLALVVAAVAIFAGGYLIRQIGVRLSWT
jgi:hypothetical protein